MTRHGWTALGIAAVYLAGARLPILAGDPELARALLAMPVGLLAGLTARHGLRCLWATTGLTLLNAALGGFAAEAVAQSLAAWLVCAASLSTTRHLPALLDTGAWRARMRVIAGFVLAAVIGALALAVSLWWLCPEFCDPDIFILQQLAVHGWSLALYVPLVLAVSDWRGSVRPWELLALLLTGAVVWWLGLWDRLMASSCFFPCQFVWAPLIGWAALRTGVFGVSVTGMVASALTTLSVIAHPAWPASMLVMLAYVACVLGLVQAAGLAIAALIEAHRASLIALNLARNQFAALMANSASMIFIKDTAGRYLQVSHSYAALLGGEPADMVGSRLERWVDDAGTVARLTAIDAEVMLRRQPRQSEEVLVVNGRSHILLNICFPLFDERGELSGMGGIAVDITAQREEERRRREAEERYQVLVEQSLVGIYIQQDEKLVYVNPKVASTLGYRQEELLGRSLTELLDPKETARVRGQIGDRYQHHIENMQYTLPVRHRDGHVIEVEVYSRLFEYQGRPAIIGVAVDISERRIADAKQRLSATVFENTSEGILIADADARIIAVNQAFTRITGYSEAEAVGKRSRMFRVDQTGQSHHARMLAALDAEGHWQGEFLDRRKNGEWFPVWLSLSSVRDQHDHQLVTHYVAVFSDITVRKEAEDRLQFLANHDPLTALPNRTHFIQRLELAVAEARNTQSELAVLFIDLDRFKLINDSFGHHAGDDLLRLLAARLSCSLGEEGLLARLGGDEFTVLFERVASRAHLEDVTHRLLAELSKPLHLEDHELFVTASIGVSIFPSDGDDAASLLRNADMAMYRSKDAGKNTCTFFAGDMNDEAFERLLMENGLRLALERQEFELHYQPQINPFTHQVEAVEALIRWRHPDLGMVSPARFIPITEENGMIRQIGDWVLRTACSQLKAWDDDGVHVPRVAVNLSPRQFLRGTLTATVVEVLENTGLAPGRLELEVTEGMLMQNPAESVDILRELKALGVQIAIDDFGTGYSSLSYLKRFPLDSLKIDRSFVIGVPDDSDSSAIAETVVAMGRKLGLNVVAEGVETSDQCRFLRACGCKLLQGYFFAKPLSADNLREFILDSVRASPALGRTTALVSLDEGRATRNNAGNKEKLDKTLDSPHVE
ncbi:EAL domain-containing protein [Rivihabitans pingtungensis]|uniref:EAL domain-containing protein n=1 Tax=Rivihabitans pingtungensis TaxID=1054498 RepID=UPI00289C388B|nr:EAL domain-containing protein [Rivihabitans pingtungensis]